MFSNLILKNVGSFYRCEKTCQKTYLIVSTYNIVMEDDENIFERLKEM